MIRFSSQDLGKVEQAILQLTGQPGNASVKINVRMRIRHPWWTFWNR